jgi:hypothetical protein
MSILLKAERSVATYMLPLAPYLVAVPGGQPPPNGSTTTGGTYVKTNSGLRIKLRGGFEFNFPVLTGQSACEVTGPGIVVYAAEGTQDNVTRCTMDHTCTVTVELSFPADGKNSLGDREELLACFEYAAGQLVNALYVEDLADLLTQAEPDFTCLHVFGPRTQQSGFNEEGRLRTYRVVLQMMCTPGLIPAGTAPEVPDATEMWIEVNPVAGPVVGAGTEDDPKLVNTAIQFDSLLDTESIETFRLGPGVFLTRGAWAHPGNCILPTGGSVIGAGMDLTTIKLDPSALFVGLDDVAHLDTRVLIMGRHELNNGGFECSDLTLDGNMSAFEDIKVMTGLWVWGNACVIRNVRVRHIRGDRVRDLECFGIHLNNAETMGSWPNDDGGSLIQDCIVEDVPPTDAYISAFYIGYDYYGRTIIPTVVERCRAILTVGNQTCFSANCNTAIRDCTGSGSVYGFYNDTGTVEVLNIENCQFSDVRVGVSIYSTNPKPGLMKNSITVTGSEFSLVGLSTRIPIGIEFWDEVGTTPYSDVDIGDNTFLATGFPLVAISVLCPVASDIVFHDNIVSPGTTQNIDAATQAGAVVVTSNSYSTGGTVPGDFPPYNTPP